MKRRAEGAVWSSVPHPWWMEHHLTLSLQVCPVWLRVTAHTPVTFRCYCVRCWLFSPAELLRGVWTGPGAAQVLRASIQNTSAALSCKYHQQLVARKLVVPNESLAYMRGAGRVAAGVVMVVVVVGGCLICLPANCFNRSSASEGVSVC